MLFTVDADLRCAAANGNVSHCRRVWAIDSRLRWGQLRRMTKQDILIRMATRLKEARTEQGLSLDAVAALSGVSRSMVSQIERGASSPTIATLWNLTQALGVDFAGLMDGEEASHDLIEVQTDAATPAIESRGTGCRIRILSPPESAGNHEVYELIFAPGGVLDSGAHGPGAREHLTVIEGRLSVTSGDAHRDLSTGDTARYPADVSHRVRARGGPARAFLIVQGGG